MSITTEEAEGWAQACDFCSLPSVAAALRSLAAERDALQAKAFRVAVAYEALKAENEKLRAALRAIAEDCEADYPPSHGAIKYAARAALGEKE